MESNFFGMCANTQLNAAKCAKTQQIGAAVRITPFPHQSLIVVDMTKLNHRAKFRLSLTPSFCKIRVPVFVCMTSHWNDNFFRTSFSLFLLKIGRWKMATYKIKNLLLRTF